MVTEKRRASLENDKWNELYMSECEIPFYAFNAAQGDIYPATLYDEPVIVHTVDLGYAEFLFVMVENNLGQKEHLYSNL